MNATLRSYILLSALAVLALLSAAPAFAQRATHVGDELGLDNDAATPDIIRIASPSFGVHVSATGRDTILYSYVLRLPTGPAPGPLSPFGTLDTYYWVSDPDGRSYWDTVYRKTNFWFGVGNSMTLAGNAYNFLGTTDSINFNVHVHNGGAAIEGRQRAIQYQPRLTSPNILGGYNANSITGAANGVTIAGGGQSGSTNRVSSATANYVTIAGGTNNNASGVNSVIMGGSGNTVSGNAAIAMGTGSTATGANSVAMGDADSTTNVSAVSMGSSTVSSGQQSIAMGLSARASGSRAVALGNGVVASGTTSVAIGSGSRATGSSSVAIGGLDTASGTTSVAMGNTAAATGTSAVAIGSLATASSVNSLALGQFVSAQTSANSMVIGQGFGAAPADRLTNDSANSLIVGFRDGTGLGSSTANFAALAVAGSHAGIGVSTLDAVTRLRVRAESNDGLGLASPYGSYVLDVGTSSVGSHLFIRHTDNGGISRPGAGRPANGAVIGIGDPFVNTAVADSARVLVRGLGITSSTYALLTEDSTGVPLLGVRDDARLIFFQNTVLDFDGLNINGHIGPEANNTFDLGSTDLQWRDIYMATGRRFYGGRTVMEFNSPSAYLDFKVFDTTLIGGVDVDQNLDNRTYAPPGLPPASITPTYTTSQTFSPGGGGSVDRVDVYFNAFTPNSLITLTVSGSSDADKSVTITAPAASTPGYLSFEIQPFNLTTCGSSAKWTMVSSQPYTVAIYDRTPCFTQNSSDRARFYYAADTLLAGWNDTTGIYEGGQADISHATGVTTGLIQYDTLCGVTNRGAGNCYTGASLVTCTTGSIDTNSFIQGYNNLSSVKQTVTYPIDYRFRSYLIDNPVSALSVRSTTNHFIGMGTTAPQGQLDVVSTSGAVIPPRMLNVDMLLLPAIPGSIVYQSDTVTGFPEGLYGYDGSVLAWRRL